ncbi:MAG: VWA domain-containing protein [Verrucomicrobiaceae bacterium]|nr:VWA domain-containing protein [Verrucomicrobiaceae bacterium]
MSLAIWLLPDVQFANPPWLAVLLLLPVLGWLRGRRGKAPAFVFPVAYLLRPVGGKTRSALAGLTFGLVLASLAAAIIGIARPQRVKSYDEIKTEGISIMLTVDVSLSMLIEDYYISGKPVNRLTAAKRVMRDFIRGRTNDRIGIVAFAGAPYYPCPMTLDRDWLETNIDRVQTGVMEDGTAIGSGIGAAANRLDKQETDGNGRNRPQADPAKKKLSKVLILLTDGANNSGKLSPQDAAKLAATLGIRIYTISIGTPGVHMIPMRDGRIITSGRQEFDEATLQEVARIGNGAYYRAQDIEALADIFKTIDQLEKAEIKKRNIVETEDLFPWPVAAALGLLLLSLLLRQTLLRSAPMTAAT